MQNRNLFLEHLNEQIQQMIVDIEEEEAVQPDFSILRELVEQVKEEIEALLD